MDGTKETPKCRQCGKKLKPNYSYLCVDPECRHDKIWHSFSKSSSIQGCMRKVDGEKCECTTSKVTGEYIKTLQGYGIYNAGLFCTKNCAVDWALTGVRQSDGIITCIRALGFKVNPLENALGAVRNLAQVYVSMCEAVSENRP